MHWYCGKCDTTLVKMFEVISRSESRQVKREQKVEELDARTKDTEASIKHNNASIYKIDDMLKN